MPTPEDLAAIEQAGRRCAGCQTGRNWRRLEVLHREGREPLVTCPACRTRLTAMALQTPSPADPPSSSAIPAATASAAPSRPKRTRRRGHAASPQHEDRLKRALKQLPAGQHSTARIAKAAGLNQAKVLSRLQALEAAGEVERIGKHWSTEPRSTDLEAAFARLEARTGNLRIIRPRGADS